MKTVSIPIIPIENTIAFTNDKQELDLEAICFFVAFGFFLDTDTYWKNKKILSPGTTYEIDDKGFISSAKNWFNWKQETKNRSFNHIVDDFSELFEKIIKEQTLNKKVILPISGGLDSRTQVVALRNHPFIKSYSYEYQGGYPETKIAKKIADVCQFPFTSMTVKKGYLWNCIEELASINQCFSEFTHPRQMAFFDSFKELGTVFSLGHMGDLLFDSFGLKHLPFQEEVTILIKMLINKGGEELANLLWKSWGLDGSFKDYYTSRISSLLAEFDIEDTNAKFRAFKTKYYVARWSSNNLSIFNAIHPVTLPYYDNRMCEFITTLPEEVLSKRKIQIEYIKNKAPDLAKITWQGQKPCNLYNYHLNKSPYNLPFRIIGKLKRDYNAILGKPYISRNWELQFVGKENNKYLNHWLLNTSLESIIPQHITKQFYDNFIKKDAFTYSHSVSMLLTLSLFQEKFNYPKNIVQ